MRVFHISLDLHYLYPKMKIGCISGAKMNLFILYFTQLALSFANAEVRLRLGSKNKLAYFVFLSACTNFV